MSLGMITIASLNIDDERDVAVILDTIKSLSDWGVPDVLMLQEVEHVRTVDSKVVRTLADRLGMNYAYAPEDVIKEGTAKALATLSRYRISASRKIRLRQFDRIFNPRCRIALAASVEHPSGKLQTFNLHLDTRINSRQRTDQLDRVLQDTLHFREPQVVAGDFNSADVFWVGRLMPLPFLDRQDRSVRIVMGAYGFFTPFVSTGPTIRFFPFRLDGIYLKGLRAVARSLKRVSFLDHRALWVQATTV